jgi:hypothetical protein
MEISNQATQIFLSYSRKDAKYLKKLYYWLIESGFNVWADLRIQPGNLSWINDISSAIKNSKIIIVLLTPNSEESKWVQQEIKFGNLHNIPIFWLVINDIQDSLLEKKTSTLFLDLRAKSFDNEAFKAIILRIESFLNSIENAKEDINSDLVSEVIPFRTELGSKYSYIDLLTDDFYRWPIGTYEDRYATSYFTFRNNKYRWVLTSSVNDIMRMAYCNMKPLSNFSFSVDVEPIECDRFTEFGFVFRFVDTNNFYAFHFDKSHRFYIWIKNLGNLDLIVSNTIKKIPDINHINLAIKAQDETFWFFINDTLICDMDDHVHWRGILGLSIKLSNNNKKTAIEYSNLLLKNKVS